jgi:hypothetical protein
LGNVKKEWRVAIGQSVVNHCRLMVFQEGGHAGPPLSNGLCGFAGMEIG